MGPPTTNSNSKHLGCLGILLALLLLIVVGIGLTFLTAGLFAPVFLIALVILLVVSGHYVVWGWWLGQIIQDEEATLSEEDATNGASATNRSAEENPAEDE